MISHQKGDWNGDESCFDGILSHNFMMNPNNGDGNEWWLNTSCFYPTPGWGRHPWAHRGAVGNSSRTGPFWKDFFMDAGSSKTCPKLFNVTSQYFQKGCNFINMPICHVYIEYTRNWSHFFSYLWCLFLAARWFGNGISWHFQVWPKCHVACRTKGCASAEIPIGKHLHVEEPLECNKKRWQLFFEIPFLP